MSYELIKKTVVEERPYPCDYCDSRSSGWGSSNGEYYDCQESCEFYKIWLEGGIVVPQGFDEVREIKEE